MQMILGHVEHVAGTVGLTNWDLHQGCLRGHPEPPPGSELSFFVVCGVPVQRSTVCKATTAVKLQKSMASANHRLNKHTEEEAVVVTVPSK